MAEDPKKTPDAPAEDASGSASMSPAPTDIAGGKGAPETAPSGGGGKKLEAEPLTDGTVPTVLAPGQAHRKVAKSKASLTTVYRRADIMTTLITFGVAVVAGGIIVGGYAFFSKGKTATPTATPKVTKLSSSDLDKLKSFFTGNTAGNSAEVLTISSASLFNQRVAIGSDLKVVGGLEVGGSTNLGDLNATKNVTLGVTSVHGSLSINGPLTVQNPALFNAGASFKGNLSTTGNGSFGGSISAASLSVTDASVNGNLNVNGHLNLGGQNPSATPASSYAASASVVGNDSGGTVTVNLKPVSGAQAAQGDLLVTVTFHTAFPRVPTIVITPDGRGSALFLPYVLKTANNFTIGATTLPLNGNSASYSFDYWVVQ